MTQQKIVAAQLQNESMNDYVKFLVFLQMGSGRTLNQAYKRYYETTDEVSQRWHTLADENRWTDRALEYDKATPPAKK